MNRRAFLALASPVVAGCADRDGLRRREPFEPPSDTVPSSVDDGSPSEGASDDGVDRVRSRLSVRSRFDDLDPPGGDDPDPIAYHELDVEGRTVGPGPSQYLAPLTERVSPDAGDHHFFAFNRGAADVTFEFDRFSLLRLDGSEWTPVELVADPPVTGQTVRASDRDPAVFFVDFDWFDASGRLPDGTYALRVPTRDPDSGDRPSTLLAAFVVESQEELRDDGEPTASLEIENRGPAFADPAPVSAELTRAETTAHPTIVRLRLRLFDGLEVRPVPENHRLIRFGVTVYR